jgi:PIN domain nuclease of toxin-antitoxin system
VKLLLDTHAFLWFASGDRRLGRVARKEIERAGSELYISAASIWEMAIKSSLKRLTLPGPVDRYIAEKVEEGYRVLPVEREHAATVEGLPFYHRDPFDRLIIAQALAEKMALVTRDKVFRRYGVQLVW